MSLKAQKKNIHDFPKKSNIRLPKEHPFFFRNFFLENPNKKKPHKIAFTTWVHPHPPPRRLTERREGPCLRSRGGGGGGSAVASG